MLASWLANDESRGGNPMIRTKWFYGWNITAMGTLGNALQGGFIIWAMGLYIAAFEDSFAGTTRTQLNVVEVCLSVGVNVMSPVLGYLVDRYSPRHIVALGAVALGTGLVLISQAGTLISIFAVYATLIPLGALALGMMPSSALIARWFRRRRGLALGISLAGSSIGGAVAVRLVGLLFEDFGWRTGLLIVGIGIIALAPLFLRLHVNNPEDIGERREAPGRQPEAAGAASEEPTWSLPQMLRSPAAYLQGLLSACLFAVTLGMLANLGLHAKDLDFDGGETSVLYSVIAFFSFAGKIGFGSFVDRFGIRTAGFATIATLAGGLIAFLGTSTFVAVTAAAVVFGLGVGGVTPVWTSMISDRFGAQSFGRALGIQQPMHIPVTASAALSAGYIADTTGSYDLVFIVYTGLLLVAALTLVALRCSGPRRLSAASR